MCLLQHRWGPTSPPKAIPPYHRRCLRQFPKQYPKSPSPGSVPLPLPSSMPRDPTRKAPCAPQEHFCPGRIHRSHKAHSRSSPWLVPSCPPSWGQDRNMTHVALPSASVHQCREGWEQGAHGPGTRAEMPLSGQLAGAAFPPREMPAEEFALHSLTPALIIGIEPASLFHKSRELISCSPFL